MLFQTAYPAPALAPFIKKYWALENCLPAGAKHIQRIVPSGLPELIFYFGNRPQTTDSKKSIPENACVSGQQTRFYDMQVSGKLSLFSILFQPHGAAQIFDVPINQLFEQNIPLEFIVNHEAIEMEAKLQETKTFQEKVAITEKFLLAMLKSNYKQHEFNRINFCLTEINRTKGLVSTGKLSELTCLSRKQFERNFSAFVGTSPRQFLKTVRFQHALHTKFKQKSLSLTQLAFDCGYYDQSHMINDFKNLSGYTPGEYFACCDPYSDYFE
jgi:AraC-like DNA-binding protein